MSFPSTPARSSIFDEGDERTDEDDKRIDEDDKHFDEGDEHFDGGEKRIDQGNAHFDKGEAGVDRCFDGEGGGEVVPGSGLNVFENPRTCRPLSRTYGIRALPADRPTGRPRDRGAPSEPSTLNTTTITAMLRRRAQDLPHHPCG
jgi:hypothetical protein